MQLVHDSDIAWHAGNWKVNVRSIGVEHEGYVDDPAGFTAKQYRASARLVAYIARRALMPIDRRHIIGHSEVPNPFDPSQRGGSDAHSDPGSSWNWAAYLRLVRRYATPPRPKPQDHAAGPVAVRLRRRAPPRPASVGGGHDRADHARRLPRRREAPLARPDEAVLVRARRRPQHVPARERPAHAGAARLRPARGVDEEAPTDPGRQPAVHGARDRAGVGRRDGAGAGTGRRREGEARRAVGRRQAHRPRHARAVRVPLELDARRRRRARARAARPGPRRPHRDGPQPRLRDERRRRRRPDDRVAEPRRGPARRRARRVERGRARHGREGGVPGRRRRARRP